jgi:hypothetical protein
MSASAKSKNAFANVIVGLLVVMAITLATASTIHFGVAVAGVDDPFPGAALPEAIISVVVLAGAAAAAVFVRVPRLSMREVAPQGVEDSGILTSCLAGDQRLRDTLLGHRTEHFGYLLKHADLAEDLRGRCGLLMDPWGCFALLASRGVS